MAGVKRVIIAFTLGFAVYAMNLAISWMVASKKSPALIGMLASVMVATNLFGFRMATLDTAALIALSVGAGFGAASGYGVLRRARGP